MILEVILGYLSTALDEKALWFLFACWISKACCSEVSGIALFVPSNSFQAQKCFHNAYRWRFHAVWLLQWWKRGNLRSDCIYSFTLNQSAVFERLEMLVNCYILYINKKKTNLFLTLCTLSWKRKTCTARCLRQRAENVLLNGNAACNFALFAGWKLPKTCRSPSP